MIARVTNNPDVQLPMVRLVKINNILVKAELDTEAQVSLMGGSLARKLGLKLRTLNNFLHFNGINSTSHELKSNVCTDVKLGLFNQEATVTCCVVNSTQLDDVVLLGLDFIYRNMDIAMAWLREAESKVMEPSMSPQTDDKNIDREVRGSVEISSVKTNLLEAFQATADEFVNNYIGPNSGIGVDTVIIVPDVNSRCPLSIKFYLKLHNSASLTYFINGIVDFISSFKFGKNPSNGIKKQFEILLNRYYNNVNRQYMDPSKVSAIINWPEPRTSKEFRSWLGLTGIFGRFVKRFSQIAAPLFDFMAGKVTWARAPDKNDKTSPKAAFDRLKDAMISYSSR